MQIQIIKKLKPLNRHQMQHRMHPETQMSLRDTKTSLWIHFNISCTIYFIPFMLQNNLVKMQYEKYDKENWF